MSKDITLGDCDSSFLSGGPLYGLLVKAGIARSGRAGIALRILFYFALSWVPLALMTISQGTFITPALRVPFLYDFSESCRFVLVLPLLIIAESIIDPWVAYVTANFRTLLPEADIEKFKHNVALAVKHKNSVGVELLLILLAFIRPHVGNLNLSEDVTSWRMVATETGTAPTAAFLWYLYVAKPMIALLWFRWLWKYIIWTQLLIRTSRLALRVTPTHPDRMGGLGFISVAQTNFAILYFALAAQAASFVGEEIVFEGAKLGSFKYLIFTVVLLAPVIFLVPSLTFSPKLIDCKRRGLLEYGALANRYTTDFHDKWIAGKRSDDEPLLGSADIQSLADLSNSFAVVQSMKSVIIVKATVITFAVASLLPFAPLLLTVYPFDELLARLVKMIL